jgi:hypothetical protein
MSKSIISHTLEEFNINPVYAHDDVLIATLAPNLNLQSTNQINMLSKLNANQFEATKATVGNVIANVINTEDIKSNTASINTITCDLLIATTIQDNGHTQSESIAQLYTSNIQPVMNTQNISIGSYDSNINVNGNISLAKTAIANLSLPSLSASQILLTDPNSNVTTGQVNLSSQVSNVLPIINGGTGLSTLTNNRIMVSSGNTITTSGTLNDGSILIGNSLGAPSVGTISAVANQTTVTNGHGTIAVGTVQNIGTTSGPTFANITLSSLTANSPVFTNASKQLVSGSVNLASQTSGILGINQGGTNSNISLTNNKVMISQNNKIVEAPSLGVGEFIMGNTTGLTVGKLNAKANQTTIEMINNNLYFGTVQDISTTADTAFNSVTAPTMYVSTIEPYPNGSNTVSICSDSTNVNTINIASSNALQNLNLGTGTSQKIITVGADTDDTLILNTAKNGLNIIQPDGVITMTLNETTNKPALIIDGPHNSVKIGKLTGSYNNNQDTQTTIIGAMSGTSANFNGLNDVIIGYGSGQALTNNRDNIMIGANNANTLLTGNNNIYIGTSIQPTSNTETNTLRLGTTQTNAIIAPTANITLGGNTNTITLQNEIVNGTITMNNLTANTLISLDANKKMVSYTIPNSITNISGTPNQVYTNNNNGNITLSLPQNMAPTSSVIFANITDNGLSANSYVKTNGSKLFTSVISIPLTDLNTDSLTGNSYMYTDSLNNIISQSKIPLTDIDKSSLSASQYLVTDTNKNIVSSNSLPLASLDLSSLSGNSIMLLSASKTITPINLSAGQILVGVNSNSMPVATQIQGTTNQINVTNTSGGIQLSTPQDLAAGSTPTFKNFTINDLTANTYVKSNASKQLSSSSTIPLSDVDTTSLTASQFVKTNASKQLITIGNLDLSDLNTSSLTASQYMKTSSTKTITTQANIPLADIDTTSLTASQYVKTNASKQLVTIGNISLSDLNNSSLTANNYVRTDLNKNFVSSSTIPISDINTSSLSASQYVKTDVNKNIVTQQTIAPSDIDTSGFTANTILTLSSSKAITPYSVGNNKFIMGVVNGITDGNIISNSLNVSYTPGQINIEIANTITTGNITATNMRLTNLNVSSIEPLNSNTLTICGNNQVSTVNIASSNTIQSVNIGTGNASGKVMTFGAGQNDTIELNASTIKFNTNYYGATQAVSDVPNNSLTNVKIWGTSINGGMASFGYRALETNLGSYNHAFGNNALFKTTGNSILNTAVGNNGLTNVTDGCFNTGIGGSVLVNVTTGNSNIGIGYLSGKNLTTGSNSMYIGHDVQAASATESNTVRFGNQNQTTYYFAPNVNSNIIIGGTIETVNTKTTNLIDNKGGILNLTNCNGNGFYCGRTPLTSAIVDNTITLSTVFNSVASIANKNFYTVATSANGKYITAIVFDEYIYRSDDYGVSFTAVANDLTRKWCDVCLSSDGKYQYATVDYAYTNPGLYSSSDYGVTWTVDNNPADYRSAVICSTSGQYVSVTGEGGSNEQRVRTSSTFGTPYSGFNSALSNIGNEATTTVQARRIAASSSHKRVYVCGVRSSDSALVCSYSNDFGVSYSSTPIVVNATIDAFTMPIIVTSDDGKYIIICLGHTSGTGRGIYRSADFGLTWSKLSGLAYNWSDCHISGDGKYVIACINNTGTAGSDSGIYISKDYGVSFTQFINSNSAWSSVTASNKFEYIYATTHSSGNLYISKSTIIIPNETISGNIAITNTSNQMIFGNNIQTRFNVNSISNSIISLNANGNADIIINQGNQSISGNLTTTNLITGNLTATNITGNVTVNNIKINGVVNSLLLTRSTGNVYGYSMSPNVLIGSDDGGNIAEYDLAALPDQPCNVSSSPNFNNVRIYGVYEGYAKIQANNYFTSSTTIPTSDIDSSSLTGNSYLFLNSSKQITTAAAPGSLNITGNVSGITVTQNGSNVNISPSQALDKTATPQFRGVNISYITPNTDYNQNSPDYYPVLMQPCPTYADENAVTHADAYHSAYGQPNETVIFWQKSDGSLHARVRQSNGFIANWDL